MSIIAKLFGSPTSRILDIRAFRGKITDVEDKWLNGEFGRRLRDLRKKAGMTQGMLAEAAGLSRTSIVNIESGGQGVSLGTLYRLADALGCAVAELLPESPQTPIPVPRIAFGDTGAESKQALSQVMRRVRDSDA